MKRVIFATLFLLAALPAFAQQKQHNVTVYLTQPACTGACSATVSFNIYRATMSTGPWLAVEQIGNVGFAASVASCPAESGFTGMCWSFVDTTGVGGTGYFYAVTAVDAGGYESGAAVTVSATTFPASPQAPAKPAAVVH